jgi:hypothetical protein
MSMGSKRKGWRSAERTFRYTSQALMTAAHREFAKPLADALTECAKELEQLHRYYYKDCKGGCPACVAIENSNKALKAARFKQATIEPTPEGS